MTPTIKRILVPTDFSVTSDEAVSYAAAVAGRFSATVHLIHVLHDPLVSQGAWEFYIPETSETRERRHKDAKDRLWQIASPHVVRSWDQSTGPRTRPAHVELAT